MNSDQKFQIAMKLISVVERLLKADDAGAAQQNALVKKPAPSADFPVLTDDEENYFSGLIQDTLQFEQANDTEASE